jgi:mannitol/fructose-specific phosphotransferase system IIA component (Ntr-type)
LPKYDSDIRIGNGAIVDTVVEKILEIGRVNINNYEKQYIDVIFASATPQSTETDLQTINSKELNEKNPGICQRMVAYLSEILNSNLNENDLFNSGIKAFMPASLVRTKYGIEVMNPFLDDIKEMYSGIFAVCFTLTKFYEDYAGGIPTDHEISFIALLVGGALHRNAKTVRAVLIGTSGIAAANIVARTIENKIDDIEIVAILSSEKINSLEDYEFDIVLSMLQNFEYEDKAVHISPIITKSDEKRIKDKCFEILSHPELQKEGFSKLVDINNILYIEEKLTKEEILKIACDKLLEGGFVTKDFYDDVIKRERIESTGIGNCVAVPHGMPDNVVEPKVFIVRSAHPVGWGIKNVDTIFLLALNFNNIKTTKAFFHDFARLLGNEEKIGRIRKTDSIAELEKVLKEELHWN